MNVVEGTYYMHEEHGRVEVVIVDDDEVHFETEKRIILEDSQVPESGIEDIEDFKAKAEPASTQLGASSESLLGN